MGYKEALKKHLGDLGYSEEQISLHSYFLYFFALKKASEDIFSKCFVGFAI